MRLSRPVKSSGFVVNSGSPSAIAVAAITVHDSAPRFTSGRPTAAVTRPNAGRLGVERERVKFVLGTLQDFKASRALGMLVISVLLVAPCAIWCYIQLAPSRS